MKNRIQSNIFFENCRWWSDVNPISSIEWKNHYILYTIIAGPVYNSSDKRLEKHIEEIRISRINQDHIESRFRTLQMFFNPISPLVKINHTSLCTISFNSIFNQENKFLWSFPRNNDPILWYSFQRSNAKKNIKYTHAYFMLHSRGVIHIHKLKKYARKCKQGPVSIKRKPQKKNTEQRTYIQLLQAIQLSRLTSLILIILM